MKEEELIRIIVKTRVSLLAYIQSIVRNAEWAEDIFQDVCVIAIEKRASLSTHQHVTAWLYKSARFEALNRLRKRSQRELSLSDELLDILDAEFQTMDDEASSWLLLEAVRHCIKLLSPQAQALVQYRYAKGMDYADIAAKLGRAPNSLYVTFCRIHATLGDCVRKYKSTGGANA